MEVSDYQELTVMSTKERFVLEFWRKALITLYKERGDVSAGEVGRFVGQARSTAKKYLDRLVSEKCVSVKQGPAKNGVIGNYYAPIKSNPS
jgi:response regulator of citrate/malate metabolism